MGRRHCDILVVFKMPIFSLISNHMPCSDCDMSISTHHSSPIVFASDLRLSFSRILYLTNQICGITPPHPLANIPPLAHFAIKMPSLIIPKVHCASKHPVVSSSTTGGSCSILQHRPQGFEFGDEIPWQQCGRWSCFESEPPQYEKDWDPWSRAGWAGKIGRVRCASVSYDGDVGV